MNRQEWLAWRHLGIGSSDCPIVMGKSRFSTPLKLWEQKILPEAPPEDTSNQFIKDAGNQAEIRIRGFFEAINDCEFPPALCEMAEFPFMKYSSDGRSPDKKEICEIKLLGDGGKEGEKDPTLQKFRRAKEEKIVPEEYMDQIQHGLLVSGAEKCYFVAYKYNEDDKMLREQMTQERLAVIEVFPDKDRQAEILAKCIEFWDMVQKKKPPLASDKDYKSVKGFTKEITKYKKAAQKVDQLKKEMQEIEEKIELAAKAMQHPRLDFGGIKLNQVSKEGSVDYKKIPELSGVDLEKYRKQGSLYWKWDLCKSKEKEKK